MFCIFPVLIEQMRREGYELSVGKPEVIKKKIEGKWHEPFETLIVDCPPDNVGSIMELVGNRRGQLLDMTSSDMGMSHLEFTIPARGTNRDENTNAQRNQRGSNYSSPI